jgi:Transmembrane secretion effector
VGAASILFLTTGNASVQLAADPPYRDRVLPLWSTALIGTTVAGAPVIGLLADTAGPRYGLAVGAAACLAAAAIGIRRATMPHS